MRGLWFREERAGFRICSKYAFRANYPAIGLDRAVVSGILFLGKGYCS